MATDVSASPVQCPDCGSPVRQDRDQLCPRCGYPLMFLRTAAADEARSVARAPGELDDATAVASSSSRVRAASDGPPTREWGVPATGDTGTQLGCPDCGYRNEPARIRCERCGHELRTARPAAALLAPPQPRSIRRPTGRGWIIALIALAVLAVVAVPTALIVRARADREPAGAAPSSGAAPNAGPVALVAIDPSTVRVTASSSIPEDSSKRAASVLDGDVATAWNSDGKRLDTNAGVRLTFRFAEPVVLARITIVNGSAKSTRSFRDNERIARLTVRTDRAQTPWTLADSPQPQSLDLAPARTATVTLLVEKTIKGERWPDLAVSEVSFERQR